MKLLLTSAGLANKSIIRGLQELVKKPFSKLKLPLFLQLPISRKVIKKTGS